MIPKEEYVDSKAGKCVNLDLIKKHHTEEEVRRFQNWSAWTTLMVVNGDTFYYTSDYESWISEGMPQER